MQKEFLQSVRLIFKVLNWFISDIVGKVKMT